MSQACAHGSRRVRCVSCDATCKRRAPPAAPWNIRPKRFAGQPCARSKPKVTPADRTSKRLGIGLTPGTARAAGVEATPPEPSGSLPSGKRPSTTTIRTVSGRSTGPNGLAATIVADWRVTPASTQHAPRHHRDHDPQAGDWHRLTNRDNAALVTWSPDRP